MQRRTLLSCLRRLGRVRRLSPLGLALVGLLLPVSVAANAADLVVDGHRLFQSHQPRVPLRAVFRHPHQSVVIATPQSDLAFHEAARVTGALTLIPGQQQLWDWQPAAANDEATLEVYRVDELLGRVRAFTLHPLSSGARALERYRIGRYPDQRRAPDPHAYAPPEGFIRVTPVNRQQRVSTHFVLGQFLCKQQGGWPKFVALQPALLKRLDRIVVALNDRGVDVETLTVMSGYRTPFYNRAIGNVAYSRHIYGDAADVYVDRDGDGHMDDLNGDGRSTVADAQWLAGVIEAMDAEDFAGGLGTYSANAVHGPFVHVDTRGRAARWGPRPLQLKQLAAAR